MPTEVITHKGCGGAMEAYGRGMVYSIEVDLYRCTRCGADDIDITTGAMEFPDDECPEQRREA